MPEEQLTNNLFPTDIHWIGFNLCVTWSGVLLTISSITTPVISCVIVLILYNQSAVLLAVYNSVPLWFIASPWGAGELIIYSWFSDIDKPIAL